MNAIAVGAALLVAAGSAAYSEASDGSRTLVIRYEAEVAELPAGTRHARVWIPIPQDDAHQKVLERTVEASHPWSLHEDPEFGNAILYLSVDDVGSDPISVNMQFRVRRFEHRFSAAAAAGIQDVPSRASLERWLEPDTLVPLDPRITKLAAQVTREAETPLAKARAIYDYVVDTMTYAKVGTGWGKGDIYWACDARTGNCTDFHALFIGLTRAIGIPSTFEIGFPVPADRTSGRIDGYHCWAQFYLEDLGWVPVDTSEAHKFPARREYFFGAHDPNRVLFTFGRDIVLEPPQQGPPLNYFIYPYVEADGRPVDDVAYRFSFEDVD